jgi:hypothetical protein
VEGSKSLKSLLAKLIGAIGSHWTTRSVAQKSFYVVMLLGLGLGLTLLTSAPGEQDGELENEEIFMSHQSSSEGPVENKASGVNLDNLGFGVGKALNKIGGGVSGGGVMGLSSADSFAGDSAASEPAASDSMPRKVIQSFSIEVRVKDLTTAEAELLQVVKRAGGYVSRSDKSGTTGSQRVGSWTLRVPETKAGDLMSEIGALGDLIRQSMNTDDVSEEYYDVEARLKTKRLEEERLIKHLKESTGKLADILAVERELSRVRGEVEQIQGRLNFLKNKTSLATIDVSFTEIPGYKPQGKLSFLMLAKIAVKDSVISLGDTIRSFALALIAWVPWLAALGVVYGLIFMFLRLMKSKDDRR